MGKPTWLDDKLGYDVYLTFTWGLTPIYLRVVSHSKVLVTFTFVSNLGWVLTSRQETRRHFAFSTAPKPLPTQLQVAGPACHDVHHLLGNVPPLFARISKLVPSLGGSLAPVKETQQPGGCRDETYSSMQRSGHSHSNKAPQMRLRTSPPR